MEHGIEWQFHEFLPRDPVFAIRCAEALWEFRWSDGLDLFGTEARMTHWLAEDPGL